MTKKTRLSTDAILKSAPLKEKDVYVEQWDGIVVIREFSKAKQQQLRKEATLAEEVNPDRLELLMFIYGVVDPIFTEQDYVALQEKSAMAIDTVLKEIMAISGLSDSAVKEAEKRFRP
jgi:hypothetical protein